MSRASKETLKDGAVIKILINNFIKESNGGNLHSLLLCIIDSDFQVPVNMIMSEEDEKQMKNVKEGEEISFNDQLRLRPDWIEDSNNNKLYFPIFSTIEEATEDYSKNFSWINMNIDTCINYIDNNKECSGLILNAFTTPIVIEGEIYQFLKNMLESERKNEEMEANNNVDNQS